MARRCVDREALFRNRPEVAQSVVEALPDAAGLDTAPRDRLLANVEAGNLEPCRRVLRRLVHQLAGTDWAWNFPVDALAA